MPVEHNPYDDEKLAAIRKDQSDPIVQYLIVRRSLDMGVGKIAAQCSHATKMLAFSYEPLKKEIERLKYIAFLTGDNPQALGHLSARLDLMTEWKETSFRTVVLGAKNDNQWERVKNDVDVFVVRDAGLTEVEPGSETAMSTWPMRKSQRPKILTKLQVL